MSSLRANSDQGHRVVLDVKQWTQRQKINSMPVRILKSNCSSQTANTGKGLPHAAATELSKVTESLNGQVGRDHRRSSGPASLLTYIVQPPAVKFPFPSHCLWHFKVLGIMVWLSVALQTPEEPAESGVCSYLSKSIIWLYTHVPSWPLHTGFYAQCVEFRPLEEECGRVPCITQEQTETEHINALRKGLVQLSQYVSVAIITTTEDPKVTAFPIKITSGRLVGKSRTEGKGQEKQIPFSYTVPQTSAVLSACQLSWK